MPRATYRFSLGRGSMAVVFYVAGKRVAFNFGCHEQHLWAGSFALSTTPAQAAAIVEQILSERLIVWPWLRRRLAFVQAALNAEAMGGLGYEAEEAEASSERRNPWSG